MVYKVVDKHSDKYLVRIFQLIGFVLLFANISFAQQQTVSVTFQGDSLRYNYNVGTEWSTQVTVNGNALYRDDSVHIAVKKDDIIKLYALASEADDYMDFGSNVKKININSIPKGESILVNIPVTVEEKVYRKRGTGGSIDNYAEWMFTLKLKLE